MTERDLIMNGNRKQLLVSGIIQLTIGTLCLIFGIVHLAKVKIPALYGFRIFLIISGLLIAITGILGILTKWTAVLKPMTGFYLSFSITSVVIAGVMIILYSLMLLSDDYNCRRENCSGTRYYDPSYNKKQPTYVLNLLSLVLGILEFGIGIWASICCCTGLNCCCGEQTSQERNVAEKFTVTVDANEESSDMGTAGANQNVQHEDSLKHFLVSGIIQLVIGTLCLILGIVGVNAYVLDDYVTMVTMPFFFIWMGLWIAITGILGILTKRRTSLKSMVVLYRGFSITSIFFAVIMFSYCLIVLSVEEIYSSTNYRSVVKPSTIYAVRIVILVFSLQEFVIACWASIYCCYFSYLQSLQTGAIGQDAYLQTQVGDPPTAHDIIQGPDGNPLAVPPQTSGPMMEQSGIPLHYNHHTTASTHQDLQTRETETENRGRPFHTVTYV